MSTDTKWTKNAAKQPSNPPVNKIVVTMNNIVPQRLSAQALDKEPLKYPSKKDLKRRYKYTPDSPSCITFKEKFMSGLKSNASKKPLCYDYGYACYGASSGSLLFVDKIVWKMHNGKTLNSVGHLDGDRYNNRIENLYDPTKLVGEDLVKQKQFARLDKLEQDMKMLGDRMTGVDATLQELERDTDHDEHEYTKLTEVVKALIRRVVELDKRSESSLNEQRVPVKQTVARNNDHKVYLWDDVLSCNEKASIKEISVEQPGVEPEPRFVLETHDGRRITGLSRHYVFYRTDTDDQVLFPKFGWTKRQSAANFVAMVLKHTQRREE